MCIVQRPGGVTQGCQHRADFSCAQAGCSLCLESLLHQHEALIHFIVRRQWPGESDYVDLIQEGRIGLWLSILRYDPGLGFTYRLERVEVDEILLLAGLPPLGRSALRQFREQILNGRKG